MVMTKHNFKNSLNKSHANTDQSYWKDIYQQFFPTLVNIVDNRQYNEDQRLGVDKVIILNDNTKIRIDEKFRSTTTVYGDILLEYLSNATTNSPGWVSKTMLCDYIIYVVEANRTAYLINKDQLQLLWQQYKYEWKADFGVKRAINDNYITLSCPVPVAVLSSKMTIKTCTF
jgi:hypothetical protein